jgi:hypothetical protein
MKAIVALNVIFIVLFYSINAISKENYEQVLFKSEESGFFCEYVNTESDSPPPYFIMTNNYGTFYLFPFLNDDEWLLLQQLKKDTPISFILEVVNYYDELNGGDLTIPRITSIAITGDPITGSCKYK